MTGLSGLQQTQEQGRQDVIEKVREKLGGDIATALSAQDDLTTSLEANATQAKTIADRIDQSEKKIHELAGRIRALDHSISTLERRVDRERITVRVLAREMYMQPDSMLVQLAEAGTLGELITNYADLSAAASRAESLKRGLEADSHRLQQDRAGLAAAKLEEQRVRRTLSDSLVKLATLQVQQQNTAAALTSQLSGFKAELRDIDKQSPELAQQVTDLLEQEQNAIVAEAMQAVWNQVETLAAAQIASSDLPSNPQHSKKHRFIWPEPKAQISQPFGPTGFDFEPPYLTYAHFHTGLDLADKEGTPVLAADDGIVILVGSSQVGGQQVGYGNYVVVEHADGLTTLYGHLAVTGVKVGDRVKQGQPLGLEGSTGNSTGPHCHFELRVDGQFVDPTPFLPQGPSADRN